MSFWRGIFRHHRREASPDTRRLYARYEIAHTIVDFAAAICFIVGSVMFFDDSLQTPAIWFFTVGSVFFAMKPSLKLLREIHLYRMGKTETLAERLR